MTRPSYEEARGALRERLGERALAHCDAVALTAAHLASLYGVDVETARLAGLLHDWCKETGHEDLLLAAARFGIAITPVDEVRPYLLHGPVGAEELAASYPGLDRDILQAVRVHTFGAEHMSDLDRVVYVADMIEPDREYKGVEGLREAVGQVDLEELMRRAYARSITHLVRRRKPLHPHTLVVWNALIAEAPDRTGAS